MHTLAQLMFGWENSSTIEALVELTYLKSWQEKKAKTTESSDQALWLNKANRI